jgi:SWI/SNF-related matrix-associated actin-dependent regulator of chromatin subfamily A3
LLIRTAHVIQNRQSNLAQACCGIRSIRRWAISGTPIQNKLTDFASIVKFLQVYPYSEDRVFEDDISRPWQNGDPQGFLRLKTLVRSITIGRNKSVVCLPPRIDEIRYLDFTQEEHQKYELAKIQTVAMLEEAISSTNQQKNTFNALERLNTLRLICSHGLLTRIRPSQNPEGNSIAPMMTWTERSAQECVPDASWTATASCSNCGTELLEDVLMGFYFPDTRTRGMQSSRALCEGCYSQRSASKSIRALRDQYTQFESLEDTMTSSSSSPTSITEFDQETTNIESMSTKVKALIADISVHCYDEKRFLVSKVSSLAAC